jgi:hypothetical protein
MLGAGRDTLYGDVPALLWTSGAAPVYSEVNSIG